MLREMLAGLKQRLQRRTARLLSDLHQRLQLQKHMLGDPRLRLVHHLLHLDHSRAALIHAFAENLHRCRARLNQLSGRISEQNPARQLLHNRLWLHEQVRQLMAMMNLHLARKEAALHAAVSVLTAVSPRAVLNRGYAIVRGRPDGELIHASRQTEVGKALEILLAEGRIGCEVTEILEE